MTTALDRFRTFVTGPDESVGLARAALAIALDDYPGLDIDACLAEIEALARDARRSVLAAAGLGRDPATAAALALSRFLFVEQGFRGNEDDYYDPRNSFLNEVLVRRVGIPITLSVLYMEVGRRLGLPLHGVSFPGRFLVKLARGDEDLVIDPFGGGVPLDDEDLRRLLAGHHPAGAEVKDLAPFLRTAGNREIVGRLLRNLKQIWLARQDRARALAVIERLLILFPGLPVETRDRGAVWLALECFGPAARDFERYLELEPGAADEQAVRAQLAEARRQLSRLH